MSDIPQGRQYPEVGALSANGSRMWDGRFWVPVGPGRLLDEFSLPLARPVAKEAPSERRGFRPGGVVLAAAVGVTLGYIPLPMPGPGSLDAALTEIAIVSLIRGWGAFGAVVVILSLGRQGIDVLLLRAMVVQFILGAAFASLIPIFIFSGPGWLFGMFASGLIWAVILGPVVAVIAALANVLWYRSLRSLRPQLRIFQHG